MKKNVANQHIGAQMASSTDGSNFTGTVSVLVTIDSGSQTAGSGTVTHKGNGWYDYVPTQAETNGDFIVYTFTGTGAITASQPVYTSIADDAASLLAALGMAAGNMDSQLSSIQSSVSNIATTGAPSYVSVTSITLTTFGTQTNTYANTDTSNNAYHQLTDSAGTLDFYYEYVLRPDEVATGLTFKGRVNSSNDTVAIQAYDWTNSAWVSVYNLVGTNATTDTSITPALVAKYTGTGANTGKVRVRFYGTGLTTATLYVDQCIVGKSSTSRSVGYANGEIWIDSTNGTAGSTIFYHGTADRPVSNFADALTLAGALNIYRFNVAPGTAIAPTANCKKYQFDGQGWSMNLGGYDYSGADITRAEYVTGTATSNDAEMFFWQCQLSTVTVGEADFHDCHVMDTVTFATTRPMLFDSCIGVPEFSPGIDFGAAIGGTYCVMGNCAGKWTISNMKPGDVLHATGNMELVFDATCIGGAAYLVGDYRLTDNSNGTVVNTITPADTAGTTTLLSRLTATRAGYLDNLDAAISTRMATFTYTAPPSVSAIRTEMDANSTKLANLDATVSSRATQTSVNLIPTSPLLASSYTAPDNASILAIKAKTDNLPATFPVNFSSLGIEANGKITGVVLTDTATMLTNSPSSITPADVWGHNSRTLTDKAGFSLTSDYDAAKTHTPAADMAAAVLDALMDDHTAAGTVGASIHAAGNAGDPWAATNTALAAYPDNTAAHQFVRFALVGNGSSPLMPAPAPLVTADYCLVYLDATSVVMGVVEPAEITFKLSTVPALIGSIAVEKDVAAVELQPDGRVEVALLRNDKITPVNTKYIVNAPSLGIRNLPMVLADSLFNLASLLP